MTGLTATSPQMHTLSQCATNAHVFLPPIIPCSDGRLPTDRESVRQHRNSDLQTGPTEPYASHSLTLTRSHKCTHTQASARQKDVLMCSPYYATLCHHPRDTDRVSRLQQASHHRNHDQELPDDAQAEQHFLPRRQVSSNVSYASPDVYDTRIM